MYPFSRIGKVELVLGVDGLSYSSSIDFSRVGFVPWGVPDGLSSLPFGVGVVGVVVLFVRWAFAEYVWDMWWW